MQAELIIGKGALKQGEELGTAELIAVGLKNTLSPGEKRQERFRLLVLVFDTIILFAMELNIQDNISQVPNAWFRLS